MEHRNSRTIGRVRKVDRQAEWERYVAEQHQVFLRSLSRLTGQLQAERKKEAAAGVSGDRARVTRNPTRGSAGRCEPAALLGSDCAGLQAVVSPYRSARTPQPRKVCDADSIRP